ncbi:MAG: glycosyltransferase [Bacteroidetes bacterium]|nr:MAG: glycosyltransferase [Bacteroidota bacterium]
MHYRKDLRIFVRECRSLARAGYQVHYVVADGQGDELLEGIHIHDVGLRRPLPWRFIETHAAIKAKAVELAADLYHFHDPELMRMGLQLKGNGAKVIADVHEDVPKEMLGNTKKSWPRRQLSAFAVDRLEQFILPKLDAVITPTPILEARLASASRRIQTIGCFPDLEGEFPAQPILDTQAADKPYDLVYIGSIGPLRGLIENVQALAGTSWTYALLGDFQGGVAQQLFELPAWKTNVSYLGFTQERTKVLEVLGKARIGMATLLPHPNYATAYCLKVFEYMAMGLAVITSDFPFWQALIDECQCGLTVDSTDVKAIQSAVDYLLTHPAEAQQMGRNGRRAIEQKYNWATQEQLLLNLYYQLLGPP